MDSINVSMSDIERLSASDKAELKKFLANEAQITQIQTQTHALADTCWKKCVTGAVRSNKLDKSEEGCLANCVQRFLDVNLLTLRHLNNMR